MNCVSQRSTPGGAKFGLQIISQESRAHACRKIFHVGGHGRLLTGSAQNSPPVTKSIWGTDTCNEDFSGSPLRLCICLTISSADKKSIFWMVDECVQNRCQSNTSTSGTSLAPFHCCQEVVCLNLEFKQSGLSKMNLSCPHKGFNIIE